MANTAVTPAERATQVTGRGTKLDQAGPSRFIADPAGLGLAGFALSTMVLSVINVGLLPKTDMPVALGLALAYGGAVQLLAGMWAFIKNDTFAAVALSSYGGFWISFYVLEQVLMPKIPAADQGGALALYLACWGFFSFYMWLASFRVSVAINAVFITLFPAYGLLAIGAAAGSNVLTNIGGGFGMATALAAWYASAAIVMNKTFRRDVLPVGELRSVQQDTATAV